jgi:hypothetical protein
MYKTKGACEEMHLNFWLVKPFDKKRDNPKEYITTHLTAAPENWLESTNVSRIAGGIAAFVESKMPAFELFTPKFHSVSVTVVTKSANNVAAMTSHPDIQLLWIKALQTACSILEKGEEYKEIFHGVKMTAYPGNKVYIDFWTTPVALAPKSHVEAAKKVLELCQGFCLCVKKTKDMIIDARYEAKCLDEEGRVCK